jgi:8-oxo-dGTP diphosphatase
MTLNDPSTDESNLTVCQARQFETSKFKIRVAVVLITPDGLLLCQQNNRPFWVLPGGTLEPGEGVEDCARREMQEETGLNVSISKLLYITDWLHPERQTHELYFLATLNTPTQTTPVLTATPVENIQHMRFVPLADLPTLDIKPAMVAQALIKDAASNFVSVEGQVLGTFT